MTRLVEHPALLKLITRKSLILDQTDGKETIGQAGDVFRAYIDPVFHTWWNGNVKVVPTEKTKVQVYETVGDGTFDRLFKSFGKDLDSLCLQQSQIVQFCRKHADWLLTDGYGTFLLFKRHHEFFVAVVGQRLKGLRVVTYDITYKYTWVDRCKHRLVVPQIGSED